VNNGPVGFRAGVDAIWQGPCAQDRGAPSQAVVSGSELEGRIPIGDEYKDVGLDPGRPPQDADHEVVERARIAAGEQDRELADQAENEDGSR
jgi:hypothetical protein